jgi:hypothetical protein
MSRPSLRLYYDGEESTLGEESSSEANKGASSMKIQIHRASDGKDFETKEECDTHEEEISMNALCGLDKPTLVRAFNNHSIPVAEALEWAGNKIANARRAAGVLKRKAKASE